MRSLLLLLLIVLSGPFAHAQNLAIDILAGRDLRGYFTDIIQNKPPLMREMRLTFDGREFNLVRANAKTVSLPAYEAYSLNMRHPNGPFVMNVLRWVLKNGLVVDLAFRSDPALQLEAQIHVDGQVPTLPRILVSFIRRSDGEVIGQGALATEDQGSILAVMREFFDKAGVDYLSFTQAQADECERILAKNMIRTRR